MTTFAAGTRGDRIAVKASGVEVLQLGVAGTIPGVAPLAAGGANGPGTGQLRQLANGRLQWKAPGSSTFGGEIFVGLGGHFLLEDGDDAADWLRVSVTTAFVVAGAADAKVFTQDRFNEVGPDDVTAAEALAGDVSTSTLTLENTSGANVVDLVVWLDPSTVGLEISDDGVSFVTPTTKGTALAMATPLAPGATDTLHIRRTIGAGASSDPDVLNLLPMSWEGI